MRWPNLQWRRQFLAPAEYGIIRAALRRARDWWRSRQ